MKRRLRLLVLVIASALLGGCHTMRFNVHDDAQDVRVEERNYYFLFALVPTRTIDVREKCPNGVASIYEQTTFVDGLIDVFTLSLVSARSTTYYCRSELTANGAPS